MWLWGGGWPAGRLPPRGRSSPGSSFVGGGAGPGLLPFRGIDRSAALRHEVPIAIGDPLLYAEVDGRRVIVASSLETDRIAAVCPDAELIDDTDLDFLELLKSGLTRDEVVVEMISRAVKQIGVRE